MNSEYGNARTKLNSIDDVTKLSIRRNPHGGILCFSIEGKTFSEKYLNELPVSTHLGRLQKLESG